MGLTRTVAPPAAIPNLLTLEELRKQLSLAPNYNAHDAQLLRLAETAVELVERHLGRALLTQTWRLTLDGFPGDYPGEIVVPRPPLQSVTSITYVDENGATQTLDAATYLATSNRDPARIAQAYNETWPATRAQREAVTVTYDAGYGGTAAAVPQPIRHAILILVATWFAQREALTAGAAIAEVPLTVDCLLDAYKTGVSAECYRLAD